MIEAQVVLKPRRAQPFYARHPWVFPGAIDRVAGHPEDGDVVDVVSSADHFVARGLYNSKSKIRVRLYGWNSDQELDREFFRTKMAAAIGFRRTTLNWPEPQGAARLISSEADGLSGLIVDQYDRWLTVQIGSLGMARRMPELLEDLQTLTGAEGIILRTEKGIGRIEGLDLTDGPVRGTVPTEPVSIIEHGLSYLVHLAEGQKTGFYLDQRDNRLAIRRYAAGRRVLDAFCYTGGFALNAAAAGAKSVHAVDVSEPALTLGQRNAEANQLNGVKFRKADVFDDLARRVDEKQSFDMVILDPPKFARARHAIPDAMNGYRRLHKLAIKLLEANGILITCCCTGLITAEMLEELFAQLADSSKRDIQIIERRGPSPDHPVSVTCPEGNYLKCFISRVV